MIDIQYQDCAGNWITAMTVTNDNYTIMNAMKHVQGTFQSRVRAIDPTGRLLDVF